MEGLNSVKLVIEASRIRDLITYRFKLKKDRPIVERLIADFKRENLGYPDTHKDNVILTTLSLFCDDINQIKDKIVAYMTDESGYGHPHDEIRKVFNDNDYDYRKMPKIYNVSWIVQYKNKGVNLDLNKITIDNTNDMKPRPYWKNGGKTEEDTEHYFWVPLHNDYHKGGIINTQVLGVHFNFAINWFTNQVLNKVTASYPVDIVDDLAGNYDIYRV